MTQNDDGKNDWTLIHSKKDYGKNIGKRNLEDIGELVYEKLQELDLI